MTEKFSDIVKDIHAEDNKYGKGAYFLSVKHLITLSNRVIAHRTRKMVMFQEKNCSKA